MFELDGQRDNSRRKRSFVRLGANGLKNEIGVHDSGVVSNKYWPD